MCAGADRMGNLKCCEVCGNEVAVGINCCPFCDADIELILPEKRIQHRIVNLEKGMPLVKQALSRLANELEQARLERCRVLTLIHGYGSSGRGGKIGQEVRAQLEYLKQKGLVNELLTGEDFSSRTGSGRQLLRRFPFLRQHNDLNRGNRGITLVVIKI